MPALDDHDLAKRKRARERTAERRLTTFKLVEAADIDGRSAALSFVGMIWDLAQQETGHSWTRLNGALRQSLLIAIEAGLTFHEDDFVFMGKNWNVGYWFGQDNSGLGEGIYKVAVKYRNMQACRAFERWAEREPFILSGERLAVGSELPLPGGRWQVTSFGKDRKTIVACEYRFGKEGVASRRKFTVEEIRGISRAIDQSKKEPSAVFCLKCGEKREAAGKCECGSVEGVRNGTIGKLTSKVA